ncbi:hypothetical protein KHQ89_07420 [Mycoplasmatota bacterium]|nr:hypothetical protein KHQ89_07420 [Mycoplasmatota bacterium]
MKKFFGLLVVLALTFTLASCVSGEVLEDTSHDYFATGNFAGWDAVTSSDDYKMEAIARNDERIDSIVKETKDAEAIYILEITLPSEAAGWDVTYTIDGTETVFDGNLTVKVIQTDVDSEVPNYWAQSPESLEVKNLTPDTLYVPSFVETSEDGSGTWNDNPVALKAGTYDFVFVVFDGYKGMALIEK